MSRKDTWPSGWIPIMFAPRKDHQSKVLKSMKKESGFCGLCLGNQQSINDLSVKSSTEHPHFHVADCQSSPNIFSVIFIFTRDKLKQWRICPLYAIKGNGKSLSSRKSQVLCSGKTIGLKSRLIVQQ